MWYLKNRTVRRAVVELAPSRCGFGLSRGTPCKWRWGWEVELRY